MKFNCPKCGMELREQAGTCIHPFDPNYGIYLDCNNDRCPCLEVAGHGKTAKDAFDVIQAKFGIIKNTVVKLDK